MTACCNAEGEFHYFVIHIIPYGTYKAMQSPAYEGSSLWSSVALPYSDHWCSVPGASLVNTATQSTFLPR